MIVIYCQEILSPFKVIQTVSVFAYARTAFRTVETTTREVISVLFEQWGSSWL